MIEQVREKAAWVAGQTDFVNIRHDRIAEYTDMLLAKYPLVSKIDSTMHFVSSPAETASYILALDSINFGSGYFSIARKADVALEYSVIAKGLKKAFQQGRLNGPDKWAAATAFECHAVFAIPQALHPALDELMGLFAHHLRETARLCGGAMEMLEEAQGSAVRLAEKVAAWPTFHDVAAYKGMQIPFFKRAQILAADMHLAFEGCPPAHFRDMDRLTIFADNMVPHVLRCDGILEYDPLLAAKIDAGETIASGSAEEVEMRASAIHAVELMKQAAGGKITSVNLDHLLWNRGYEPEIYARPSHKTMTVWY